MLFIGVLYYIVISKRQRLNFKISLGRLEQFLVAALQLFHKWYSGRNRKAEAGMVK